MMADPRSLWRDNGRHLSRSLGSVASWTEVLRQAGQAQVQEDPTEKYRHIWKQYTFDEQARFQQRQLMEKEQKLLKMYENSQAKVLGRLGGGQTPPAQPQAAGKVRQMFEERRTKAGIDKSYPLQPLPGSKVTGNRNLAQNVTLEIKQVSTFNGDSIKSQKIETRIIRDKNSNDENVELNNAYSSVDQVDHHHHHVEPVMNKLPNVGKSLRTKTHVIRSENNNTSTHSPKEEIKNPPSRERNPPIQKVVANNTRTTPVTPPKTPSSLKVTKPPPMTPPQKTATPMTNGTSEKVKQQTTPTARSSTVATPPTTMNKPKSFTPSGSSSEAGDACGICGRRFASDRIEKHQQICSKTATKKRKPYDALKHRVAGTEAETYVRHIRKTTKGQPSRAAPTPAAAAATPTKQSNWRKKHEEFIMAIRAAKEVQAHLNRGGKLADLPPPPPSDTSDYVACPHCGRRFNQGAADRHIPKCANFQFNKPKPATTKRR